MSGANQTPDSSSSPTEVTAAQSHNTRVPIVNDPGEVAGLTEASSMRDLAEGQRRETRFRLDPKRVKDYFQRTIKSISGNFYPEDTIPIGENDFIQYGDGETMAEGGVTDRPISDYQTTFFPREFDRPPGAGEFSVDNYLREAIKKPSPEPPVFASYDEAFAAGRTVLEVAPGNAIALMQLAQRFPDTTFIGLDLLYQEQRQVSPTEPGLQLTQGNWHDLAPIPDSSVDTLISRQGIGMWGLSYNVTLEDRRKVVDSMARVLKPGGVVKLDAVNEKNLALFDENVWEINYNKEHAILSLRKREI